MKSELQKHMKDPEFAKAFFKEDLLMAVTEAVCEVLISYGFTKTNKKIQSDSGYRWCSIHNEPYVHSCPKCALTINPATAD